MTLDRLLKIISIEANSDFKIIKQERLFYSEDITKNFEKNEFGYFTEKTIRKLPYYRVHNVVYGEDGLSVYVSMTH